MALDQLYVRFEALELVGREHSDRGCSLPGHGGENTIGANSILILIDVGVGTKELLLGPSRLTLQEFESLRLHCCDIFYTISDAGYYLLSFI